MKKLLVLPLLLLLAGCNVELPPIDSGFVAHTWGVAASPDKTELTPPQLAQLSAWFATHQKGWKYKITDTAPGTVLLLKDKAGRTTLVNLLGNTLWVGSRFKALTSEELRNFEKIIDAGDRLPTFGRQ